MKRGLMALAMPSTKNFWFIMCGGLLVLITFTMLQDFVEANIRNSRFYFSESLLFSSFWWLFVPLLFLQCRLVNHTHNQQKLYVAMLIIFPMLLQLFVFPLLVYVLSSIFYYHSYAYLQTLRYTLAAHLFSLVFMYTVPVLAYMFFKKKLTKQNIQTTAVAPIPNDKFLERILVAEGYKKLPIAVSDIVYIQAKSPYISIALAGKKYLHAETLRSMNAKLDPAKFVRIHKSTIVQLNMVASYSSRLNGDYDLLLTNKECLRLSRNYAIAFKRLFSQVNRLNSI